MKITFLGGAQTVTGSKYLIENKNQKLLIDCGLFQGLKELRSRNWLSLPVPPSAIDAVLLTHAHIDHSGYIPRFINEGFEKWIYATEATIDLCEILLPDSGYLQEEDTRYANRKGYSKHKPALPLYTEEDGRNAIQKFKGISFHKELDLDHFIITYYKAGHMLSAASILVKEKSTGKTILFSGDLGRSNDLINPKPQDPVSADYVVLESTYGNRLHEKGNPLEVLKNIIQEVTARDGIVLIPAFAVGRTQLILNCIFQIFSKNPELKVPVYVNSPMATKASKLFYLFHEEIRLSEEETRKMFEMTTFVGSVEESKALNNKKGPMIIVSSSGMLTGGRILHHIKAYGNNPRNALILAGYQAPGTRGEALANGKRLLRIHGKEIDINAEVYDLNLLSGHADQKGLLKWIGSIPEPPRKVFLTHGTLESGQALGKKIQNDFHFKTLVPELGQSVEL